MNELSSTRQVRRGGMRPIWLAVGASFILGASVAGYIGWRIYEAETASVTNARPAQFAKQKALPAKPSPTPSESAAAEAVERVAEQQGGIDQRLAAAEQRLARLDLQAQAAAGNVARAEGLLIAFATRRAIEKGAELGYLADQLRLRFGDALPNSVDTILTFAEDPVTLDQLIAQLDGLAPKLESGAGKPGLERFADELGALFTIRRESAPSPQPQQRLERARQFLRSGRTDVAAAEVRNLPGAKNEQAQSWLRDAERYAATQRALDLIETSAVLEPHRLRDGAGNRVEQPGLAE